MTALRRTEKALRASSAFTRIHAEPNTYPLIFARGEGPDMALILFHPADRKVEGEISLPPAIAGRTVGARLFGNGEVQLEIHGNRLQYRAAGISFTGVRI